MILITKDKTLKKEYPYHLIDGLVYDAAGELSDIGDFTFVFREQFYFQSKLDLIDDIPKLLYKSGYIIYLTDGFVRKVAEENFLRDMFLDKANMGSFEVFDKREKVVWIKDRDIVKEEI